MKARPRVREPTTTITDLVLAVAATWFAVMLSADTLQSRVWAGAFASAATGAALGAVSHGFVEFISARLQRAAWHGTVFFAGSAGILFALAGLLAAGVSATAVIVIGAGAEAAYLLAVVRAPAFRTAAIAYAISFAVLIVCAVVLRDDAARASAWIVSAVVLTGVGVAIQRAGIRMHRHVNNNDIYHLFQLAGFICLYQAARSLA